MRNGGDSSSSSRCNATCLTRPMMGDFHLEIFFHPHAHMASESKACSGLTVVQAG